MWLEYIDQSGGIQTKFRQFCDANGIVANQLPTSGQKQLRTTILSLGCGTVGKRLSNMVKV